MKIAIGADHAGYEYKQLLIEYLVNKGFTVINEGTDNGEACDYPDFAREVSKDVVENRAEFGILICGTGIGMSIAANKVDGIRAAVVCNSFTAESSKTHNHANIIAFGSRVNTIEEIKSYLDIFMNAKYSDATRHINRVEKIQKLEVEKWEK